MKLVSTEKSFDGEQRVYEHDSDACATKMRFALFLPPAATQRRTPLLTWLSGLTCNEENFITKAGAQRLAARLGFAILAPDTSPRGDGVPDDPNAAYDLGLGAGFYVNATEEPWRANYQMESYVAKELQQAMTEFPELDLDRQGIFGHSMGGHGALTLHLRHPSIYKSVSAFAPIVAPSQVPWGQKALSAYLGDDRDTWGAYDACELVSKQASAAHILIDQGSADDFLAEQLRTDLFAEACRGNGQAATINLRDGYSHSYFFIASFIDNHLMHHAEALELV